MGIMEVQLPLFDRGRSGYVASDKAQALLEDTAPLLWSSIMEPWADLQDSRRDDRRFRSMSSSEIAWWMHGQIKQEALRLIDDNPTLGLTPHTSPNGQFYLSQRDDLILVFKKLRRVFSHKLRRDVLTRSNYPTKHNRAFWAQRVAAGFDAPRLIVGYEPIDVMSDVRIHIGYPRTQGCQFDWTYELTNPSDSATRVVEPLVARIAEPVNEEPGFKVVPKSAEARRKRAQ